MASIRYEIIGRAVIRDKSELERHYLKLLYRGDGTPWWACSAGMELPIPADFEAKPGQFVTISIKVN
jgi:hypothetical protein